MGEERHVVQWVTGSDLTDPNLLLQSVTEIVQKAKIRKPRRAKKRINNLPDIIDQINLSVYILLWNPISKWSYWWYLHFRLSCFINKLDPLLFFVCWGPMITNTPRRPTPKSSIGKPVCWQNIETSLFTCTCFRIIPSSLGVIHILRNHG